MGKLTEKLGYHFYRRWFCKPPKVKNPAYKFIEDTFNITSLKEYWIDGDWFRFETVADFISYAEQNNIVAVFESTYKNISCIFFILNDRRYIVEVKMEINIEKTEKDSDYMQNVL